MKFTEASLEAAIIQLLGEQGYDHVDGASLARTPEQVLLVDDLVCYLTNRYAEPYAEEALTPAEIRRIIGMLEALPAGDLYESNKQFCRWLADGFTFKRDDPTAKDMRIQLLDYMGLEHLGLEHLWTQATLSDAQQNQIAEMSASYALAAGDAGVERHDDSNIYKLVSQLEIEGIDGKRIPDVILYINGLPLVVFEFKSAIREEQANIHQAWHQLTSYYRRDIAPLFVFNAFCVISDGVNNKMGSLFAPYEFFYGWRKVTGCESVEKDGIDSLFTMINGLFDKARLRLVLRDFIFFPDVSNREEKLVCRYPQFYAVNKLYHSVHRAQKRIGPEGELIGGDGKGGTYFGATGCGKSYTMQFLARRLMKSQALASPTIILITDRTDLDDQLSKQFTNAKHYLKDQTVVTVTSREDLRAQLKGRSSGGVFLTTIHKFSEDTELLTERSNVICISDEAHRSQINLEQKVVIDDDKGTVRKSYGFAYHLHQSLPNATFVGFTGTPIDATLDVFGAVVDSYTMSESVNDEITVRIVYEGRAAKVLLDETKLQEIERYYDDCAEQGANEHQIEESKKTMASMGSILGDKDRIAAIARDFAAHYQQRVDEGSTIKGKAMFVSSSREIAFSFYNALKEIKPEWFEVRAAAEGEQLTDKDNVKPLPMVNMVMTSSKEDGNQLRDLLGNKEYRKELDRQFKHPKSNFKIAIVVDMWLTGFDVPFLDTLYIDKPVQRHNLIQTISRVNRKFEGKDKGLVVDYIGIKRQMNQALAMFSKADEANFEDIDASVAVVKDHLDLVGQLMHGFDERDYFSGDPVEQLHCLNRAADFVLTKESMQRRFMALMKRLKAAYDVCCGSERLSQAERDLIHLYLAVRSIIYKLTKGEAPDTAQMNTKVRQLIEEAIRADGVEEIFHLGAEGAEQIDIFDEDYLARLDKLKLPNTKIELLKKMLAKALAEFKKTNQLKAVEFSSKLRSLVDHYNERKEEDAFTTEVHQEAVDSLLALMADIKVEMGSFADLGISVEEKAFYDILKHVASKYQFAYEDARLLELAAKVKAVVDDKASYPDWNNRDDIKSALKVELIMLLSKNGYPPVTYNEVYQDVFAQAENFKANRV
ncbi:type I restriction endonuclease subunit R [Shewanella cyperi]|uniref:Type I restriction enzyme endonuclease subunit n=1 Tax=Shewanella cyperi TaxID=2814292 RepID=A0A975AJ02_9GAMM|nr:HsdR family type I site-specific deoxyribonuclease [Shewanella cyperi]QSX28575.1 type I restriction endonuclease subunit R [Shewanella cyperi]